ncbi:metal-dependent hydrolase [Massilia sp. RP-1-19]|uniref:Metal-dependent hydrolase n=1 Tax=Massilia polaris TaxID=2728846 RepID=A0A848HFA8_9BURK|nr:metal-dependent hydrolase [Massilia polaris]NML59924.1 metal-dependent hydrolase [Massilia polaris]
MDNLTHSLTGLAVGEFISRSLPPEADEANQRTRRRLLLVSCWAASNFPDLDLVLTPLLPAPLGYLLHHRGHTHTLLYALPQALLLAAMLWLLWPAARKLLATSTQARRGLLLSIGAGFLLHMSMDYLNSYGVHPFYPFDPRWFYGDMVFIIEPLFWIAFGVPLAMTAMRRISRRVLLCMLIGVPLAFTVSGHLHPASTIALALLAIALGVIERRAGSGGRQGLLAAFGAAAAFIMLQSVSSDAGKSEIAGQLRLRDPGTRVADVAMSAFPSNPLCWAFVAVEHKGAGFRVSRGVASIAPGLMPAASCPAALAQPGAQRALSPAVAIVWQQQGTLAELRNRQQQDCYFDAWLRFARTPALNAENATDVRFGDNPDGNFATIRYASFAGKPCPAGVPAWGYPRSDLLGIDR